LNRDAEVDIVVYYCHGGGFTMGSSHFYLEFLVAWLSLLHRNGYKNPSLFALDYSLVPDAAYPQQLNEAKIGYGYVKRKVKDTSRIVMAGDSAGATLILSLLLDTSERNDDRKDMPGLATLISPWTHLISKLNQNTPSDYLDAKSLHKYALAYLVNRSKIDPLASPGDLQSAESWTKATPKGGWHIIYGAEEVLAPNTRRLIKLMKKSGAKVVVDEEIAGIHAWPVVRLYLGETQDIRLSGLYRIIERIVDIIPPSNPDR